MNLEFPMGTLCRFIWRMIDDCPGYRPSAAQLAVRFNASNRCCPDTAGHEPLEAALERSSAACRCM